MKAVRKSEVIAITGAGTRVGCATVQEFARKGLRQGEDY
jgi:NADP-dependent 3-hydroxy acid dehydrogenase YdfG